MSATPRPLAEPPESDADVSAEPDADVALLGLAPQAALVVSCDLEVIEQRANAAAKTDMSWNARLNHLRTVDVPAMAAELRQSRQRIAELNADLTDYGVAFGRLAGESAVQHALSIKQQVAALTEKLAVHGDPRIEGSKSWWEDQAIEARAKLAAREQICTQFAQVTSVLDEYSVLPADWAPFPSLERAARVPGLVESVCQRAEAAESLLRQREEQIAQLRELVKWTLGEGDEFPGLPNDWPARAFYWRAELRRRYAALADPPVGTQEQK